MAFADSTTDKLFYYLRNLHEKKVSISPKLFRSYTCPEGCGGCCGKFSLDYYRGSKRLAVLYHKYPKAFARLKPRDVEYNGVTIKIYSDLQEDNKSNRCRHLDLDTGRCEIYG